MDKRFALSVAGIAGAATAGSAFAGGDAVITLHFDAYAGECRMDMSSTGGNYLIAAYTTNWAYGQGGSIVADVGVSAFNPLAENAYSSGYLFTFTLADATGTYNVLLRDSYGDGWAGFNATGTDAFVATGSVSGDTQIGLSAGASATGSITITPAPGALALLGLAGLAGRRKRA